LLLLAHPTITPEQLARDGCVVHILIERVCRLDFLGVLVPPASPKHTPGGELIGDAGQPTGLGHLDSPIQGLEILLRPDRQRLRIGDDPHHQANGARLGCIGSWLKSEQGDF